MAPAGAAASGASSQPAREEPQGPAAVAFAADFPELVDHEWGIPLGGFGGVRRGAPIERVPVIFVHGNTTDHGDWYPVRDAFREAGWSDQELWALSYNGLGSNSGRAIGTPNPEAEEEREEMGWDGRARVTNNEVNVPDLHDFVMAVRDYTGSRAFAVVGHSLGVTLARRTLKVHPELRDDLVAFVGIAGPNHGTSLCPPGSEGIIVACDELAAGSEWLAELNGPDGTDETYGRARWLTVYDGSGAADPAFLGPTYAQSPALLGADNREFPGTYHNDLRLGPAIVAEYRGFLEDAIAWHLAEAGAGAGDAGPGKAPPTPPVRGAVEEGPAPGVEARPWPTTQASRGVDATAPAVTEAPAAERRASNLGPAVPGTGDGLGVVTVERIGRHWSGGANVVMTALLLGGLTLIAYDFRADRRRRGTGAAGP
jgi:pimeloyl-ACP methyl ester carboxylesterase